MSTEPSTGIETGVWFEQGRDAKDVWQYRGTLPVLIQFHKKTPEHSCEPYHVSRCPRCEFSRLHPQFGLVKRWMILPP